MAYTPAPIHEWQNPPPWPTCNIDSQSMGASKSSSGGIPSTRTQANLLWDAVGRINPATGKPYTGYNSRQVRDGIAKLYNGHAPLHYRGSWSVLREHLTSANVRQATVVYGSYPRLPAAIRNVSVQPGYLGLHAIYTENIEGNPDEVLVIDPLTKAGAVKVRADDLRAFASHPDTNYEHDVYREGEWTDLLPPLEEDDVTYLKGAAPIVNRRASVREGATIRTTPAYVPDDPLGNRITVIGAGGSSAPIIAWVTGSDVHLANGTVIDADTTWAALQAEPYGVGYCHKRDVTAVSVIEQLGHSDKELSDARAGGIADAAKNAAATK